MAKEGGPGHGALECDEFECVGGIADGAVIKRNRVDTRDSMGGGASPDEAFPNGHRINLSGTTYVVRAWEERAYPANQIF